ncbi:protein cereblon [Chloropicon roscoffensis]|uniref:Protein cereblon n=2 Tax=Chloropicon roscoffensis TaxID=1461544 RepID=A0A7S3C7M8_9CHLO|mmetsp:Transcript_11694/g.35561  ORF Transcript_11694/g.35561 Transcript_11694/m.35561 type:complete len:430 (+) Transcript_11694:40-1329(+)
MARGGHGEASTSDRSHSTQNDWADVHGRHFYLGNLGDLQGAGNGSGSCLPTGTKVELSIYATSLVCLFPGEECPLILQRYVARTLVHKVCAAPRPYTRLFGIAYCSFDSLACGGVGCTVELVQVGDLRVCYHPNSTGEYLVDDTDDADGQDNVSLVVRVHQRFEHGPLEAFGVLPRVVCTILDDSPPGRIPPQAIARTSFWEKRFYRPYNAYALCDRARELFSKLFPGEAAGISRAAHDPVRLSFLVASRLPASSIKKQQRLLEMDVTARLGAEVELMTRMTQVKELCCANCGRVLADSRDIFSMTKEGSSGVFVNGAGALHDIVTITKVDGVTKVGRPSFEHSWFPGYMWTIILCNCGMHLGWYFSGQRGLERRPGIDPPLVFFGIRRVALAVPRASESDEEQEGSDSEDDDYSDGGDEYESDLEPEN